MEYFLYGIGVGIVITIVSLITITMILSRDAKKGDDNEWEA